MSEVERTLDALSGYQPEPYQSSSGQRAYAVRVVPGRRGGQRAQAVSYELQVGPYIWAEFFDLYLANAVASAVDECLPRSNMPIEAALRSAVMNLLNAQAMKFILVEVLRNAQQRYEQRSCDPMEGAVFECRKLAAVLKEELTALGHKDVL